MKIRSKIAWMGGLLVLMTAAAILGIFLFRLHAFQKEMDTDLRSQIGEALRPTAEYVYQICVALQETSESEFRNALSVMRYLIAQRGGLSIDPKETRRWKLRIGESEREFEVPQLLLGKTPLASDDSPQVEAPIVDEIKRLFGFDATIFQRLNPEGDMLRVVTNVVKEGRRQIGTYTPAKGPDGHPNPIISKVLSGEVGTGRTQMGQTYFMAACEPFRDEKGAIIGMFGLGIEQKNLARIRQVFLETKVGIFVIGTKGNQRGRYILSYRGERDGENLLATDAPLEQKEIITSFIEEGVAHPGKICSRIYRWRNQGEQASREKIAAFVYFEPWDWLIGVTAYLDDFTGEAKKLEERLHDLSYQALLGVAGILLIGLVLCLLMGREVAQPLEKIAEVVRRVEQGDLAVEIPEDCRRCEEIEALRHGIQAMLQGLNAMMRRVREVADRVTEGASQIAASSLSLSQGATEQASSLEEISSSMTLIGDQLKQSATHASQANEHARAAETSACSGSDQTTLLIRAMEDLNQAGRSISKIMKSIDDIAFQTKLLAINAAVEAARAGTHGKGFAVVAEEVRNLADRSAKAARETADLIETVIKKIQHGSEVAQATSTALTEIVQGSREIAELIHRIALAANEQAEGVAQINLALRQIEQVTHLNTANAEETAAASETLKAQAQQLRELLGLFRLQASPASPASSPSSKELGKTSPVREGIELPKGERKEKPGPSSPTTASTRSPSSSEGSLHVMRPDQVVEWGDSELAKDR